MSTPKKKEVKNRRMAKSGTRASLRKQVAKEDLDRSRSNNPQRGGADVIIRKIPKS